MSTYNPVRTTDLRQSEKTSTSNAEKRLMLQPEDNSTPCSSQLVHEHIHAHPMRTTDLRQSEKTSTSNAEKRLMLQPEDTSKACIYQVNACASSPFVINLQCRTFSTTTNRDRRLIPREADFARAPARASCVLSSIHRTIAYRA